MRVSISLRVILLLGIGGLSSCSSPTLASSDRLPLSDDLAALVEQDWRTADLPSLGYRLVPCTWRSLPLGSDGTGMDCDPEEMRVYREVHRENCHWLGGVGGHGFPVGKRLLAMQSLTETPSREWWLVLRPGDDGIWIPPGIPWGHHWSVRAATLLGDEIESMEFLGCATLEEGKGMLAKHGAHPPFWRLQVLTRAHGGEPMVNQQDFSPGSDVNLPLAIRTASLESEPEGLGQIVVFKNQNQAWSFGCETLPPQWKEVWRGLGHGARDQRAFLGGLNRAFQFIHPKAVHGDHYQVLRLYPD